MIAFLTLCYCGLVWLVFFKLALLPWNRGSQGAVVGIGLAALVGLVVALGLYQPYSTDVRVYHTMVQIAPRVTGRVIEVAVKPHVPIAKDDVLFRVDPRPFEYAVRDLEAQLGLARIRRDDARALVESKVEPQATLDRAEAEASSLEARLDGARLDLAEATVYAPGDGIVTNLVLRPGQIATKMAGNPVMTFIHDEPVILAVFPQQNMRHIRPGDGAEIALDRHPGKILQARVDSIVPATGEGQLAPTGTLLTFEPTPRARFAVRLELDDGSGGFEMPAGAGGNAAIYTQKGRAIRIVRKVIIRVYTWLNYLG
jgi:multidrug resistance efflux pump